MISVRIHVRPQHSSVSLCTIPEDESLCFVGPTHDDDGESSCSSSSSNPSSSSLQQQQHQQHDGISIIYRSSKSNHDAVVTEGHELINQTRMEHGIRPLQRCIRLDALAAQHATVMAKRGAVRHSVNTIHALQVKLAKRPEEDVGENVSRGRCMAQIHRDMTRTTRSSTMPPAPTTPAAITQYEEASTPLRDNILSSVFYQVGMGMARGKDGYLYLCQLFQ
jgi:uncharacterized protein YkwD